MKKQDSLAAAYLVRGLEISEAKTMDEALEYISSVIGTAASYAANTFGAASCIQYLQSGNVAVTMLPIDDMIKVKS